METKRGLPSRWDVWLSVNDEWPTFLGMIEAESFAKAQALARLTYGPNAEVVSSNTGKCPSFSQAPDSFLLPELRAS